MKNSVKCIYHKNCADGLSAAAVVYESNRQMEEADFFPMHYGDAEPAELAAGDTLYIVDFSLPTLVMSKLAKTWHKIVVLDHHESAVRKYENWVCPANVELVFDMKKSGAVLAWEYFNPKATTPFTVVLVQDRDLWQWAYEDTAAFSAALSLGKQNVASYYSMLFLRDFEQMLAAGKAIVQYQKDLVAKVYTEKRVVIAGYSVPIVNTTTLISEVGEKLAKAKDFAVMFFIKDDEVILSFRSKSYGKNVAEIAEKFGGGGHKHAAGAKVSLSKFIEIYLG